VTPTSHGYREGDSPAQIRAWVEDELAGAIQQLTRDFKQELHRSRDDIRGAVLQESREFQNVLVALDIDTIVEDLVRDAPESLRLFAHEVDAGNVVRESLSRVTSGGDSISAQDERKVRRMVELELEVSLREMELGIMNEIDDWRRDIRDALHGLSPDARKTVSEMNLDHLVLELTAHSPAPVRQLVSEVDVPGVVAKVLNSTL
jgi:hypothetical protein